MLAVGDTREPADVERMADQIRQTLGPVTLLVNNAVYALQKQFLDFTVDEWRSQVDYKAVGERGGFGEIGYAVTNGGAMALTRRFKSMTNAMFLPEIGSVRQEFT